MTEPHKTKNTFWCEENTFGKRTKNTFLNAKTHFNGGYTRKYYFNGKKYILLMKKN